MATVSEHHKTELQTFLDTIAPWKAAYADAHFAFIGTKKDGIVKVLQGQLLLGDVLLSLPSQFVETASLAAGFYTLADAEQTFEDVLGKLVSGVLNTPYGPVALASNEPNKVNIFLNHQLEKIHGTEKRKTTLKVVSAHQRQEFLDPDVATRELREAERPYNDINELSMELMHAPYAYNDYANIEVLAFPVAEVDVSKQIAGVNAQLDILMSHLLETEKCSLGCRVLVKGRPVQRYRLAGEEFVWKREKTHVTTTVLHGSKSVQVPDGAVVQCFVSYAGQFQHTGWVYDPAKLPNVLRIVHSAFDPDLQVLQNYLSEKNEHSKKAQDFETGIANLLFMLGFSVDPLFGKPLGNGPDLIATTRQGHIALVECTTSEGINKDGKLGKLVARAQKLRDDLSKTAYDNLQVLPVIVTPLPRNRIADEPYAKSLGVLVLTKEDLDAAIERTMVPQDTDVLFSQMTNAKWSP